MSKTSSLTIADIARLAGVSKSTVSRALNGSPLIPAETTARIQAIAREHNFQANAAARNLSLRQSRTIAFVAPALAPDIFSGDDLFGLEILRAVGDGLHALGYDLLIVHAGPAENAWAHDYLASGRVDGFILMTSNHRPELIRSLVEMNAPFIGWGTPLAGLNYCSVTGDNLAGGSLATRHLLGLGRQQVAFLGGPPDQMTVQKRFQGYADALQAAGQGVDPLQVAYSDYSYPSGMAAMQRLLEGSPELDGVFVNSDLMAIGAIKVMQSAGKRVPQDIAVVGYDDLPIARYNNLPLTTIRQNIPLAGKYLAQNLIQTIQNGEITQVTIPVELVIRESA